MCTVVTVSQVLNLNMIINVFKVELKRKKQLVLTGSDGHTGCHHLLLIHVVYGSVPSRLHNKLDRCSEVEAL